MRTDYFNRRNVIINCNIRIRVGKSDSMKKKLLRGCLLAIAPLLLSGCFTAIDQIGDGPGHVRAKTVALDAVTLPAQAAGLAVAAPIAGIVAINSNYKEKEAAREYNRLMSILEKDPKTGLIERWDQTHDALSFKDDQRRYIFAQSFSNPNVKYSDDLLEEIYNTCPLLHASVFHCQTCSQDFLIKYFGERLQEGQERASINELAVIISNPKMPLAMIENIAITSGFIDQSDRYARLFGLALDQRCVETWMPLLENNPGIALTERWDIKNKWRKAVFAASFTNSAVKYTGDDIEAIFQSCPSIRDDIFRSQFCTKEFLSAHFDEEFDRGRNVLTQNGLNNLVANPNTPIELVEKIASARYYSVVVTSRAQKILAKRQSELVTKPTNK